MYLAEGRVRGECDVPGGPWLLIQRVDRSYARNWCRSAVEHGFFTMSSRRTLLQIRRIRCESIGLGMTDLMFLSGPRIGLAASQLAQWLVLRCDTQRG